MVGRAAFFLSTWVGITDNPWMKKLSGVMLLGAPIVKWPGTAAVLLTNAVIANARRLKKIISLMSVNCKETPITSAVLIYPIKIFGSILVL